MTAYRLFGPTFRLMHFALAWLAISGCRLFPAPVDHSIREVPYEELVGKLAFTRSLIGIGVVDATSKTANLLRVGSVRSASVSLSPDGNSIAYSQYRGITNEGYQVYTMTTEGGAKSRLTQSTAGPEGFHNLNPAWSADGTKLFYLTGTTSLGNSLAVINTDGTGREVLLLNANSEGRIGVSPDGVHLALAHGDHLNASPQGIYVFNLTEGSLARLTSSDSSATHYGPAWSPDGNMIAFVSRHGPNEGNVLLYSDIIVMDVDGTNQQPVIHLPFDGYPADVHTDWSPRGDKLAFNYSSNDGHIGHIYTVNMDGTGLTQITSDEDWDGGPSWGG